MQRHHYAGNGQYSQPLRDDRSGDWEMTARTACGYFCFLWSRRQWDAELAAASARYGICELLLSGVTTVLDMYYFEEKVAHIMDQMGIRGIAGETVMEDATCDAPVQRKRWNGAGT